MKKVPRSEIHRKGVVKISYDQLEAMRPVLAGLERSGWDIRYKVDDVKQVKEVWMEHLLFDVSKEYVEYWLHEDGRVSRIEGVSPTDMGELPLLPANPAIVRVSKEIMENVEYQPWPDTMRGIERR